MPNYDYKCKTCGNIWSTSHSIKETAESLGLKCPECNGDDIFKYLGNLKSIPIKFKGTGFSVNDGALDKLGFPKNTRNDPEVKKRLNDL